MTRDGYEAFLANKHFGSLDGIRAFSVAAVVWHHSPPESPVGLASRGFLGVDMFFALSGFLIVTLLLREKDRNGQISLKDFYIRRTLRIFPAYYGLILALSVAFFFAPPTSNNKASWFIELPILLTYMANIIETTSFMAHAWSLAAEEQFYLVWPSVERYSERFAWTVFGVALAISQFLHFQLIDLVFPGFSEAYVPAQMFLQATFTPILFGVALAHLFHHRASFDWIHRYLSPRWAAPALFFLLLAFIALAPNDMRGWPRLTTHVMMIVFLASCVIQEEHGLSRLLKQAPLVRLGMVSYGVYLFHMVVAHASGAILNKVGVSSRPVSFALILAGTWLIAETSFRLYEMPFLRLKTRFQT